MKTIFRNLTSLLILVIFYSPVSKATVLDISEDDFIIGQLNAPVTIIEYASLSCSHCADFHINTLGKLKENMLILVKL